VPYEFRADNGIQRNRVDVARCGAAFTIAYAAKRRLYAAVGRAFTA
jgi:hypothetical protein